MVKKWIIISSFFLLLLVIAGVVTYIMYDRVNTVEVPPESEPVNTVEVQQPTVQIDKPANTCGNKYCELSAGETDRSCPGDCVPTCGDGVCQADVSPYPEHYQNCGDCAPEVCGDGVCKSYENVDNCESDCT